MFSAAESEDSVEDDMDVYSGYNEYPSTLIAMGSPDIVDRSDIWRNSTARERSSTSIAIKNRLQTPGYALRRLETAAVSLK